MYAIRSYYVPLRTGQVNTAWVVAAGMQQHDITGRNLLQTLLHAGKINGLGGRIIICVFSELETGRGKDATMVSPGRFRQPHLRPRLELFQLV